MEAFIVELMSKLELLILAKNWQINAEFLYFKGIQIRSFRFESTSAENIIFSM